MRGLGIIIGYILGNAAARDWCIEKICQASCIIEKELKKTPMAKLIIKDKKDEISGDN
jgi:hypothetical protein